jgi:probable HAF family extracellular repeat protein
VLALAAPAAAQYSIVDLGTPGAATSIAVGINDRGQVVGASAPPEDFAHAALWENGDVLDLGTLDGPLSAANDINQSGAIVGFGLTELFD